MSGSVAVIGQILIELLNISIQSMKAAQIISNAQNEGRDITNEELQALDTQREDLMKRWTAAVEKKSE